MADAKLTSKGQLTIPREVRKELGLRTGDRVVFERRAEGYLVRPRKLALLDLVGSVATKVKGVTVEQMNAAIRSRGGRK